MARKPKAPSPEEPAKPKRKMTQEEQSALFIETARLIGAGETEEEAEQAFRKIAEHKPGFPEKTPTRSKH